MHVPLPMPQRMPQRAVVAGAPGPQLTGLLERLAATLDVPLVPLSELDGPSEDGPGEVEQLAAFDGWVTTAGGYDARPVLLDRADLVVAVLPEEPGTLRGLVRRTVRRIRAEAAPEVDLTWLDALPSSHPDVEVVRLVGGEAVEAWLSALSVRVSG